MSVPRSRTRIFSRHALPVWGMVLGGLAAAGSVSADSLDQAASPVATAPSKVSAKDSAIASRVKARLAARHLASRITVSENADRDGIIWLSGTVPTVDAAAQATRAAMETEGVTAVHNTIIVQ